MGASLRGYRCFSTGADGLRAKDSIVSRGILGRDGFHFHQGKKRDLVALLDAPLLLCAEHDELTGNLFFQDNLLHFLLHRD